MRVLPLAVSSGAEPERVRPIFLKLDLGDAEDVSRRVKATLLYLAGQVEPSGT